MKELCVLRKISIFAISILTLFGMTQLAIAQTYDEKLEFAGYLEESLGHFWAIEQNLDDNNAELALVHATHPIAELYLLMKPELVEANPEFDSKVQQTLMQLAKKTGQDVTRQDAQIAINDAKQVIEEARDIVVGKETSNELGFQVLLIQNLLKSSVQEYREGVIDGQIDLMPEFQDGSSFVWRSQQIFEKIKTDLPQEDAKEINLVYSDLWNAYDNRADADEIEVKVDTIINRLGNSVQTNTEQPDLLAYVENIRVLLNQVKSSYSEGDKDSALAFATKAYLDNFEYLEATIEESDPQLKEEIEFMMREELREKIKNNVSPAELDEHVDAILEKMDSVAKIVPEFGTIATMVLIVGIISSIAILSKSKRLAISPRI